MISIVTVKQIEQKFNKEIRYPSDCEALAGDIVRVTKNSISTSTLKRIFGFIKGSQEPRLYTLDVLAKYLGFVNWDNYLENLVQIENSDFISIEQLEIDNLSLQSRIEIKYAPSSRLILEYHSDFMFVVLESENCKLEIQDKIKLFNIIKSYPLIINHVIRNNVNLGSYKAAKISGITEINILEK